MGSRGPIRNGGDLADKDGNMEMTNLCGESCMDSGLCQFDANGVEDN